jgi:WD40 repeat protein
MKHVRPLLFSLGILCCLLAAVSVTQAQEKLSVVALDWSSDGSRLAASYMRGLVDILDSVTLQTLSSFQFGGNIRDIKWSPKKPNLLAVGLLDDKSNLRVLDADSGKEIWALDVGIDVVSIAFSLDGQQLAAAVNTCIDCPNADIYYIRIWDMESGKLLNELYPWVGNITEIDWNDTGSQLAASGTEKNITIMDVASGETVKSLTGFPVLVDSVAWSPDGTKIAGGSIDSGVKIWDVESGKEIAAYPDYRASYIKWSPDGQQLAVAGLSATIIDALTGNIVAIYSPSTDHSVAAVAWKPDGTQLTYGTSDSKVEVVSINLAIPTPVTE